MESQSISKIVASWLMAKPFSLSRMACARILVRQFGSVLWISLRRKRSSSVMGATNLVAVLIVGIVPENFCFATYRQKLSAFAHYLEGCGIGQLDMITPHHIR